MGEDGLIPFRKMISIQKILQSRTDPDNLKERRALFKAADWEKYDAAHDLGRR